MIPIVRSVEPSVLSTARQNGLPGARRAVANGESPTVDGYQVAKHDLARAQFNKCGYCETLLEQPKYHDVDHYRPASVYWWLGWTWENLLFACEYCNRDHKRAQFPLGPGSTPLVAEQGPPGAERPLLLDPAAPSDAEATWTEIRFLPRKVDGVEQWAPIGTTARGRETVSVCGLDRASLVTLYTSHVRDVVRPRIAPVNASADQEDVRGVVEAWDTARRSLLGPSRPFRALSRDAMNHLVREPTRATYKLQSGPP